VMRCRELGSFHDDRTVLGFDRERRLRVKSLGEINGWGENDASHGTP